MIGVFLTTLREGIRSKIFWSLLFFGALCLAASALFPSVNQAERARFLANWSLSSSTVVAAILLVFLAAPAGSREVEERTLHQVLVKPVNSFTWFAGRIFAYGALATMLFVVMGIGSYFLLLACVPKESAPDSPMLHPSQMFEAQSVSVEGALLKSADWEVPAWLDAKGRIVFDFADHSEALAGKAAPKLLAAFPGSLTTLTSGIAPIAIRLKNQRTGQIWTTQTVIGQEEKTLDIDPALLSGPVRVEVYPAGGGIGIGSRKAPETIGIRFSVAQAGSFASNFLSAFFRRALAVSLFLGLAFFFSLIMNGKLALALSLVLFLAGSYPFYARVAGRMIRGELQSEHSHEGEMGHHGENEAEGKERPVTAVDSILAFVADGLAMALPDFDRFDSSVDLISGHNIAWQRDLRLLLYLAAYLAVTVCVGGLVLARREWI